MLPAPHMNRDNLPRIAGSDAAMRVSILVVAVLVAVIVALLPNAHEADVIKSPLLIGGAGLVAGLALSVALRRGRVTIVRTPVDIPLLLLLILAAVQTVRAPEMRSAREAALLWGAFGVLFFAGTHLFRFERTSGLLARTVVAVAGAVVTIGVTEFMFPDLFGGNAFVVQERRVHSTLGSASILAAFNAASLPILLSEAGRRTKAGRIGVFLIIAGAFFLLLASGSRGGMIAAVVSAIFYVFLTRGNTRKALLLTGGILCLLTFAILVVPSFHVRFLGILEGTGTASLERRSVIWEAGWKALRNSPLTGHGTGSVESIIPLFRNPDYWLSGSEDIVRHAHDELLELWAEFGVAGPVLWLVIMGLTIRRGIRAARNGESRRRGLAAAFTAGLIGVLLDNITGISLSHPSVGGMAWLFAGVIWGIPGNGGVTMTSVILRSGRTVAIIPGLLGAALATMYIARQTPLFQSEGRYSNARILEARGDSAAEGEFIRAYEDCPWNPKTAMGAAGVYLRMRRPLESLEALDAVQRRFPFYPRSSLLRSMVLASLGRIHEADSCVQKAIAIRSGPEELRVRSVIARALGDVPAEREALRRLLFASLNSGRDFFVQESCARLRALSGPDSMATGALIDTALRRFGGGSGSP